MGHPSPKYSAEFKQQAVRLYRERGGTYAETARELGIGNGCVESVNNKIKVTVRMGYGFRNVDNLTALLMLKCSDMKPGLPGRKAA